jgi:hypothetical protein
MAPTKWFSVSAERPALILYRPGSTGGLWDSDEARMRGELEDALEVFVTSVGSGRGAMKLDDAAAAARFMGCRSSVVIAPEGCEPPEHDLQVAARRLRGRMTTVHADWTPTAVIAAYHRARNREFRAA